MDFTLKTAEGPKGKFEDSPLDKKKDKEGDSKLAKLKNAATKKIVGKTMGKKY